MHGDCEQGNDTQHASGERWVDRINEAYYDGMGADFGRRTRDRINWMCSYAKGATALDVGCSQGIAAILIAREGMKVTGIDLLQAAIAYANHERDKEIESVRQRLEFRCCELAAMTGESFDTVLLGEVVEHQTNPEKFIRAAARLVAEGGRLVITVPFGLHPFPDHKSTILPRLVVDALQGFIPVTFEVVDDYIRVVADKLPQSEVSEEGPRLALAATEAGAMAAQQHYYLSHDRAEALQQDKERLESSLRALSAEQESQLLSSSEQIRASAELHQRHLERIEGLLETVANERARAEDSLRELALVNADRQHFEEALQERIRKLEADYAVSQQKQGGHYAHLVAERERTAKIVKIAQGLYEDNQRFAHSVALALGRAFLSLTSPRGVLGFPRALARAAKAYRMRQRGDTVFAPLYLPPVAGARTYGKGDAADAKRLSVVGWHQDCRAQATTIMSVMDEFSRTCFAPHANLIEPRPDNWEGLLEEFRPALLLVESSWKGNHGSWQYRVANYANPPGNELGQMVQAFKARGIPTVFWNKEDPVHFSNFIDAASSFDHILTTAEEAMPRYRERSSAKVGVLQFAAEESIHNPIGSALRNDRVCFAGSFYASRFEDRREDQLMLLDAASGFNLDIYDRNFDPAAKGTSDFGFPEHLASHVRGRLPYDAMAKAHREYRVFLNVNSVIDSPTMFSRRVFELLACGTPVVSTWSRGTEETFGSDLVWHVRNQHEAEEALTTLMSDDREWRRRSLMGIRAVLSRHTARHRFQEMLQAVGIAPAAADPFECVLVVAEAASQEQAEAIVASFSRQQMLASTRKRLLLLMRGDFQLASVDGVIEAVTAHGRSLAEVAAQAVRAPETELLALMHADAVYGGHHLQDLLLAARYSKAAVVGRPVDPSADSQYRFGVELDPWSVLINRPVLDASGGSVESVLVHGVGAVQDNAASYAADNANFARLSPVSSESERIKILAKIEI